MQLSECQAPQAPQAGQALQAGQAMARSVAFAECGAFSLDGFDVVACAPVYGIPRFQCRQCAVSGVFRRDRRRRWPSVVTARATAALALCCPGASDGSKSCELAPASGPVPWIGGVGPPPSGRATRRSPRGCKVRIAAVVPACCCGQATGVLRMQARACRSGCSTPWPGVRRLLARRGRPRESAARYDRSQRAA